MFPVTTKLFKYCMKTDAFSTKLILTLTLPPPPKKKRAPKQVYKILHLLCFSKVWLLFLKLLLEIADAPTNFVQVSKNLLGHKKTDSPAPAGPLEGALPLMATILNH